MGGIQKNAENFFFAVFPSFPYKKELSEKTIFDELSSVLLGPTSQRESLSRNCLDKHTKKFLCFFLRFCKNTNLFFENVYLSI